MKPFLLTMGMEHYPESGDGDWVNVYATLKEAESDVINIQSTPYNHGYYMYRPLAEVGKSRKYCWYEIIDLREWGVFDESK